MTQPQVKVGIMSEPTIKFNLSTDYVAAGVQCEGPQEAVVADGMVEWRGKRYEQLEFNPVDSKAGNFELVGVPSALTSTGKERKISVSAARCALSWRTAS